MEENGNKTYKTEDSKFYEKSKKNMKYYKIEILDRVIRKCFLDPSFHKYWMIIGEWLLSDMARDDAVISISNTKNKTCLHRIWYPGNLKFWC